MEDADEELLKQLDDDEELDEFANEYQDHNYYNPLTSESSILSPGSSAVPTPLSDEEDSGDNEHNSREPKTRKFKELMYKGIKDPEESSNSRYFQIPEVKLF